MTARSPTLFSVLLCTLDRPELAQACVDSLNRQTTAIPIEIIVVDQSDQEDRRLSTCDNVRYVHIRERGLSNARNIALGVASGDWIVLADDDATYDEDFLRQVALGIERYGADGIVGMIRDPRTGRPALRSMRSGRGRRVTFWNTMSLCMSPSCVLRRDAISSPAFDTRLGLGAPWGAGEETDCLWRMLVGGATIWFDPECVVYHHDGSSEDGRLARVTSYGFGFGGLFAKWAVSMRRPAATVLFAYSLLRSCGGWLTCMLRLSPGEASRHRAALVAKARGFCSYCAREGRRGAGG